MSVNPRLLIPTWKGNHVDRLKHPVTDLAKEIVLKVLAAEPLLGMRTPTIYDKILEKYPDIKELPVQGPIEMRYKSIRERPAELRAVPQPRFNEHPIPSVRFMKKSVLPELESARQIEQIRLVKEKKPEETVMMNGIYSKYYPTVWVSNTITENLEHRWRLLPPGAVSKKMKMQRELKNKKRLGLLEEGTEPTTAEEKDAVTIAEEESIDLAESTAPKSKKTTIRERKTARMLAKQKLANQEPKSLTEGTDSRRTISQEWDAVRIPPHIDLTERNDPRRTISQERNSARMAPPHRERAGYTERSDPTSEWNGVRRERVGFTERTDSGRTTSQDWNATRITPRTRERFAENSDPRRATSQDWNARTAPANRERFGSTERTDPRRTTSQARNAPADQYRK